MIGQISNSILGYKVQHTGKKVSKYPSDYKLDVSMQYIEKKEKKDKTVSKDDVELTDEMRKDLISAYKNINWKSDDSVSHLLKLGVSVGKVRDEDIDEALICVEDAKLLNKYSYIPEDGDDSSIHNMLGHDKAQMRAAIDFYHYVPEYLEKRVASLQRVDDFLDWVSKLK